MASFQTKGFVVVALVSDGIILVGDSAGQANPLLLEGIRYAIEFGRLAGEVGARSLSKNAVMSSLMEYDTICREKLESKIKSALKVAHRWIGLSDDEWDKEWKYLRICLQTSSLILSKGNLQQAR